jgi:ABC-type Fe3+ transport system permease subunit
VLKVFPMLWFERNKERERFYLLPGQGGRASRRKRRVFFWWAIAAGLFVSAIVGGVLYLISRSR